MAICTKKCMTNGMIQKTKIGKNQKTKETKKRKNNKNK